MANSLFVCLSQCPRSIGQLSFKIQKLLHHQFIFICLLLELEIHACTVNNRMEILKIEITHLFQKQGVNSVTLLYKKLSGAL